MKFAFISESPADEAALHAFCETLAGCSIERIASPVQIRRGWPAFKNTLGPALRSIRYQTKAEAIIVVVDSDGADLTPNAPTNRYEEIQNTINSCLVPTPAHPTPPSVLLGMAVPAIEAWWLAHSQPGISENAWLQRRKHAPTYDKLSLKRSLYGTDKPSLQHETDCMMRAARKAASHASTLCARFPLGLANIIRTIRTLTCHT